MPAALVVIAHPEPTSFTAAWARASIAAAEAAGHAVLTSDLCAMGFDPVEHPRHYGGIAPFDPLKVQEAHPLPADAAAEAAKVRQADLLVLHFPLWWFGPPAILKGWCDRVLAHGHLHTSAERFDTGRARGKRVLFCVSTGATEAEVGPDGKEGDLALLLWPLAYTFRYLGATVLQPLAVHGVHGYHRPAGQAALETRLAAALAAQRGIIAGIEAHPVWPFNAETDFDADGRLRPEAQSHSPMIRHATEAPSPLRRGAPS